MGLVIDASYNITQKKEKNHGIGIADRNGNIRLLCYNYKKLVYSQAGLIPRPLGR
jgi:hypothetical protein